MPILRPLRFARHALVVGGLAIAPAAAQPADPRAREVDAFMKQQMAARHIPGAAVVVVSHGKPILLRSYGQADVEQGVPVTEHSLFELASVTKQFTATAIMMLVQDHRLALDDSLASVLDSLPAEWRRITIRQLLNHTSGIPDYPQAKFHFDVRRDYTHRELLGLVADAPLEFAPGSKHSYSNAGYVLLGVVIEKRSGQSYEQFLRQRIFQPLGMTDTRLNDRSQIMSRRARGYSVVEYQLINSEYTSPTTTFSAGALVSSAADMARWLAALGSTKLLAREHWEAMWSKTRLTDGTLADYGSGWYVRTSGTHKRLEHSGGIQGFATYTAHFPDDSLSIMYLTNANAPVGRLGPGIFEIYLPSVRPSAPRTLADADTATTQFLLRVANALAQGKGDSAWFTPRVVQFYFPDRIQRRKAIGLLGPIRSFALVGVANENGRQRRSYRVQMGTTWVRFTFWLTPDRLVDDVNFEVE